VRLAAVAAIVALTGMAGSNVSGQGVRFRSGVDVVRVDALVTEERRIVTGLRAADFELRDNGVLQTIDALTLEPLPLTLTFVLDTSGSVDGGKMADLTSAVDIILRGLRAQDRVGLVTFSHRLWQRLPLTSDVELVRRVLADSRGAGGTSLNDAVYAGLALGESQDARALLLVFSDGLDNSSWLPRATVERAARRADAVIYGVVVAGGAQAVIDVGQGRSVRFRPEYLPGQTDFFDALASATGGRVIKADDTVKLPKAFDEILQEFRTRYVLTYSPSSNAPGWHTIDLKVKGRRAEINARRGYERTR
jgi:VWFA-related protein